MIPASKKALHERKVMGLISVKTTDIMHNPWFTDISLDLVDVTDRSKTNWSPSEVYIARLCEHRDDFREAALRTKPFAMSAYTLSDAVKVLNQLGISYEHLFRVTEMQGSREDRGDSYMLALLSRIPMELSNEASWIAEDPRRFFLVLNEARRNLSREDKRAVHKSHKNKTLALVDDESEAMRMKLRYGGTLFDLEEIKRGS